MKKFILLFALLLVSTASFSQNVISLFGKATDFFVYMEEGKYDSAHLYFDVKEQAKISPENLKTLWQNVKAKLGKLQAIDPLQSKVQGEFFAVTVECKFESDKQNFILGFNKEEKMVGIFMPPNAAVYTKPSYAADTNKYQEKSIYLSSNGHQLAAVVTTPKNTVNFPMVVFVHGSGPGDMDETVGPNKPFKDIALGLASKGIGSVRYVKRTLVYPNEFTKDFTVKEEVTDDAVSAIALAKTVKGADPKSIYLFGHSLGGMLAPKIATLAPDLNGVILAAAPARKLTDIIIEQNKYYVNLLKDTTAATKKELDAMITDIQRSKIVELGGMKPDSLIIGLPASYWVDLNTYDQVAVAKKIEKRMFVLQGGNDFQVTKTDYDLWNAELGKKKNVSLRFYPEINHLMSFQTAKGTTDQYKLPVSVFQKVVDDLALWIKGLPLTK